MLQVKVTVMMKAMGEYVMGVRDDGCYRDASLLKIVLRLMKRKGSIYLNENIHTPI